MKLKIVRKKTPDGISQLALSGEMTVYSIKKLKEIMIRELITNTGITINCSDVDEADTSAFQMLVYLRDEALRSGKSFAVTGINGRLESISGLYRESF